MPGAGKAPEALRQAGLHRRLHERRAVDAGVVLAGRYVDDDDGVRPSGRVRNETELVGHARRLADRRQDVLESGHAPLVIGGDCSVLIGIGVALSRRGRTSAEIRAGATGIADAARRVAGPDYWVQVDVDVLDPRVMPAVDSPSPGGGDLERLITLLQCLSPGAVGASVTVFDPDLDPDGRHAATVSDLVVDGLAALGTGARAGSSK